MSNPPAIIALVTLGVSNLARSIAFYEALGFKRKARKSEGVAFFEAGGTALAVYPNDDLAKDAGLQYDSPEKFRGIALAWNCDTEAGVEAAIERARRAGATVLKAPHKVFWGGYLAHFADPDGHLWEVAHNPGFPLSPDGKMQFPD